MKSRTKFICQSCGYESAKWVGKCQACEGWNTMVEEQVQTRDDKRIVQRNVGVVTATPLSCIEFDSETRMPVGIEEFDRVLGGGLVKSSLVLLGGDPGIGKSTILLQVCGELSAQGRRLLYVSGEESAVQVRMRAERLAVHEDNILILCETSMNQIMLQLNEIKPDIVVVDSIQTMYREDVTSAPGSVTQVRECAAEYLRFAKTLGGPAIFLVGHVTKDGSIAGPRILEHMVDVVLQFEGEKGMPFRLLRGIKNRFGSTHELGVFEMNERGMTPVENPSALFLSVHPSPVPGCAVVASMEGTRPFLAEVQALIAPTPYATPRRTCSGFDSNRLALILAVLEKRGGMELFAQDAYLNVVGGLRLDEPAADLGVAVAIVSSLVGLSLGRDTFFAGEIGLTGEVRPVGRLVARAREGEKLGFRRIVVAEVSVQTLQGETQLEVVGLRNVGDLVALCKNS
jgi:DNA repair protein RadA/Sms